MISPSDTWRAYGVIQGVRVTSFFAWHDFEYGVLEGAYEPFLDTICDMYCAYVNGDFAEF